MRFHVDVQGLAELDKQVLLIQLRITLECVILNFRRDVAQLGNSFLFQFFKCMRHDPRSPSIANLIKIVLKNVERAFL
jgi:hypothetical protein